MYLITKAALSRITVVLMIALFVVVGGAVSATQLKSELLPNIDIPTVSIFTVYPGAAPDDVLRDVTQPLERAVAGVTNLKTTNSTSNDNISIVSLEFEYGTDMEKAQQTVQDLVNRVTLPANAQRPTLSRFNFSDIPAVVYTLNTNETGADALSNLRRKATDTIVPELQSLNGVNSVNVGGGSTRQVIITLDEAKLARYGLTAAQVTGVLQANNVTFPSGTIVSAGQSVPVVVGHEIASIDDLRTLVVGMQMPAGAGAASSYPGGAGAAGGAPGSTGASGATGAASGTGAIAGAPGAPTGGAPAGTTSAGANAQAGAAGAPPASTSTVPGANAAQASAPATPAKAPTVGTSAKARATATAAAKKTASAVQASAGQAMQTATAGTQAVQSDAAQGAATPGTQAGQAGQTGAPGSGAPAGQTGTSGAAGTPAAAATPVAPKQVQLQDVATVELGNTAASSITRTNGRPSLSLAIYKTQNANTVQVAHAVDDKLNALKAQLPGTEIVPVFDQANYIEDSLNSLIREGLFGAILAILVILLFLRSIRSTLVTAVSIPMSMLIAFILLNIFGISLNIMSLAGLAVAVGRVVDDAIVVLENIYRHVHNGEPVRVAALNGTREVASAITSSTLTTVSVFLPLGFLAGFISEIFRPFALAVALSLLASLLAALTVVPVLAALFIKARGVDRVPAPRAETAEERGDTWIQRLYTPAVKFALRNGWTKAGVLLAALVLFVGSLVPLATGAIGFTFINFGSDKVVNATITLKPGTDIGVTSNLAASVEQKLQQNPAVSNFQTTIGSSTSGGGNPFGGNGSANVASMIVNLKSDADLDKEANGLRDLLKNTPNIADYTVSTGSSTGGPSSSNFAVLVTGPNPNDIRQVTTNLIDKLKTVPNLTNVTSDLAEAKPEIRVQVDPAKALLHGSTAIQIAGQVRNLLTQQKVTQVTLDSQTYDIVVGYDQATMNSIDSIRAIKVGTVNPVALSEVATVDQGTGPVSINRVNQQLAVTVQGTITSNSTSGVLADAQQVINGIGLPAGTTIQQSGVAQLQGESFGQLGTALAIAIGLVYVVMVLFFGSLSTPFVIMFSLPLASIGSFVALWVTGRPFGISAMIGILMLVGIVVTNAIVLLDMVEQRKQDGYSTYESLVYGGRIRVRPILMTAIATIIALIPLALSNEGSLIAAELGTVVIGGLFSSTFLTLIVVPVIYSLLDSLRHRLTGGGARARNGEDLPAPAEESVREPELVTVPRVATPAS